MFNNFNQCPDQPVDDPAYEKDTTEKEHLDKLADVRNSFRTAAVNYIDTFGFISTAAALNDILKIYFPNDGKKVQYEVKGK